MENEFKKHKIFIFAGHFGSGKTEVSANFALELKHYSDNINVIDLDIVNPFFRTIDFKDFLENQQIKVIGTQYAGSNIEIPSIPPNLPLLLDDPDSKTIVDVGGDDIGARILYGYREFITVHDFRLYCVINIRRPETDTVPKIINTVKQIELSSGIKISALVNNTNLSNETEIEDIIDGQKTIEEVSRELNIPIAFICAEQRIIDQIPSDIKTERLVHKINVRLPWEK